MSNIPIEKVLEYMVNAEKEAASLMMQAHNVLAEAKTGRRDVVTEYDRRIQELLIEKLSSDIPGALFFCEEEDRRADLSAEHVFIIDPIDGTMNFVKGFHHSCISAAYSSGSEIKAAAVYNPYADELFTAVKGGGAFLNGKKISVSDDPVSESIVCCGTSPYYPIMTDVTFDIMRKIFKASLDIRREGSAALDLCSVAAGRAGVYFELSVYLWDYAAAALIVTEAGGRVCDINGEPLPWNGGRTSIVAGSEKNCAEFLSITNKNIRKRG